MSKIKWIWACLSVSSPLISYLFTPCINVTLCCYYVPYSRVTLWIFDSGVADPRPFLQLNSDGPSLQTASGYTGYLELDNLFTPGVSEGWFCARAHTHRHTHAHTHSSHTHIPDQRFWKKLTSLKTTCRTRDTDTSEKSVSIGLLW